MHEAKEENNEVKKERIGDKERERVIGILYVTVVYRERS